MCALVRLCDLDMGCKKHVNASYPGLLTYHHNLRDYIPVKFLIYEFCLSSSYSDKRGLAIFCKKYTTNSGGILMDQDVFNMVVNQIGIREVKMYNAAVPVHIWNHRLVKIFPKPKTMKGVYSVTINWVLKIL